KRLSLLSLALSLLAGLAVFSATNVQGQEVWRQNRQNRDWNRDRDRDHDRDRDRDSRRGNGRYGRGRYGRYGQGGNSNYGYNIYQAAQQQGYRDGLYTGSRD